MKDPIYPCYAGRTLLSHLAIIYDTNWKLLDGWDFDEVGVFFTLYINISEEWLHQKVIFLIWKRDKIIILKNKKIEATSHKSQPKRELGLQLLCK